MKNREIREAAIHAGVKLWEIAEALGVADTTLSRRMRRELPDDEKEKILGIIDHIRAEKGGA